MSPLSCHDCGLEYGGDSWIETSIHDDVWNIIRPIGSQEGCGILCISCIARRLNAAGLKNIPVRLCGTEPIYAVDVDPNVAQVNESNNHKTIDGALLDECNAKIHTVKAVKAHR